MDYVFLLGIVTGMRAMTGIALVCWAAWLGWLPENGWAIWTTYLISAIVFSLLALGEDFSDTLPNTPSRKSPFPLVTRLCFGGLVGALGGFSLHQPVAGGLLVGMAGALVGTYGGFTLRAWGAKLLRHDLPVALGESALAAALAYHAVFQMRSDVIFDKLRGLP